MSAVLAVSDRTDFFPRFLNTGSSKASRNIQTKIEETVVYFRKSVTRNHAEDAINSLKKIFSECSEDGWDGYDAKTISQVTFDEAYKFLNSLPSWLSMPEIVPEPNGDIGFEWYFGKDKVFIVSVEGLGQLSYAGILGLGVKAHGAEIFDGTIPKSIIENVSRIAK
jgi:hypothetical protein